jgi:glyoxylase-like metal-dependent hydrolase (beta-lactamase superfamily II)
MGGSEIPRYQTSAGRVVYCVPVQAFDTIVANTYVVTGGSRPILVDCGSGLERSDRDLAAGLDAIRDRHDPGVAFGELGAIVITHGHIDHFGGLTFLREHTAAPIAVHLLDRRVLSHYEERVVVASKQVRDFLATSGITAERRDQYMQIYLGTKSLFHSVDVNVPFEEGKILDGELEVHHVPGHCPGQVCVRVDDILLTADHLLEKISPHLSPEAITQNTGLGHYLSSLEEIERLEGIRVGLGGHQGPIHDVRARISEIRRLHLERLERLLDYCVEPRTIAQISRRTFGPARSYHVLLALLEAGALVEYLCQRGELVTCNVEEIETETNPAFLFRRE